MFELANQTAIVTGGASGIGAAIADAFVQQGAAVVVLDLDVSCVAQSEKITAHACDVTDERSVADALAKVAGDIDILVTCAGIVALDAAENLSLDAWRRTLDTNLTGTFVVAQAVGRRMIERGYGRIVTMASQAASVAIEKHAAYCASKFAVVGLTKVLALEWGGRGVTVNSVSPTVVMTELGRTAWAGPVGEAHKAEIPVGRFAEPEEVAAAAVFLASREAAMVNGADLVIDGGFTIH